MAKKRNDSLVVVSLPSDEKARLVEMARADLRTLSNMAAVLLRAGMAQREAVAQHDLDKAA